MSFFAYFWICKFKYSFKSIWILGIIVRCLIFYDLPNLSDDFYRFIWDGSLIHEGINPYSLLPIQVTELDLPKFSLAAMEKLNSSMYATVYPPFNQFFFWLSTFPVQPIWSVGILRIFLFLTDIASTFLIHKLRPKTALSSWFFLNPLLIFEGVGNVHFESMMIFFLLLTLYFISVNKFAKAGFAWGLAIATKLIPLLFLPALMWYYKWKRSWVLISIALLVLSLTLMPMLSTQIWQGTSTSLKLYFQHFEFNASIYFIFRAFGFWFKGYNIIGTLGPIMGFTTLLLISFGAIFLYYYKYSLENVLLYSLTLYLIMSTTIHPWYVLTLIPLGLLSGHWYPIIWSFTVFWSYFGYDRIGYNVPTWWILSEYIILFGAIGIELKKKYAVPI
ncbi:MAG: hypothetical protein CMB82_12305 [Flammeovirgaceae bacterium]|nr:hypothetical protein [Flammeovirgaceae bacterium]